MANKREQQAEKMSKTTTNESPSSRSLQAESSVCENDGMLLEMLVRLPDLRSAIRCSSVSKRWRSLLIGNPSFLRSFIRRNLEAEDDSASPPYTFLFQYSVHQRESWKTQPGREYVSESHPLLSEESEIFHRIANPASSRGANSSNLYLDFIPEKGDKAIKARFDDLLLVSGPEGCRKYYICNPLTEKWIGLAEAPLLEGVGPNPYKAGLVCKQDTDRRQFRVALFYNSGKKGANLLKASVFSSKTGKWSESAVRKRNVLRWDEYYAGVHPWSNGGVVAARGGVLHYLTDLSPSPRCTIVAFDPFKEGKGRKKWRFVDLPAELDALYLDVVWCWLPRSVNLHLGACRGRLRLARWPVGEYYSQPISRSAKEEALKVWELCDNSDDDDDDGTVVTGTCTWRLVHEASVEGKGIRYVLGLHPDNGDVMFVYCKDGSVCEYNVVEHKLRRIGEFPVRLEDYPLFSPVCNPISVVPIVHSYNWPTPLPVFPI